MACTARPVKDFQVIRLKCDVCSSGEDIQLPASVDEVVRKSREFERQHKHA
jgi:hypothetical protein